MLEIIGGIPQQILEGMELSLKKKDKILNYKWNSILFCGMGGSGIGGKITKGLFNESSPYPLETNSDYEIPGWVDSSTLVVGVSYSGNTEETLSAIKKSMERGAITIGITTGGKLSEIIEEVIKVPGGLPPRCAIGYLTVPQILLATGFNQDVIRELHETAHLLKEHFQGIIQEAGEVAKKISHLTPVIYASAQYLSPISYRFQCQFNENSKTFAHSHSIPEMNHNEIMGLKKMEGYALLWLFDKSIDSRYIKRVEITNSIVSGNFSTTLFLKPMEAFTTKISKAFYYIVLGDLISYFMAEEKGVDPFSIKEIDELKKRMKE